MFDHRTKGRRTTACLVTLICCLTWSAAGAPAAAQETEEPEILYVEGDVQAPVKIQAPAPVYTEVARKERTQGLVIVRTVIDEHGDVVELKLLKGQPHGLSAEAMAAIVRWRFEPATLDGQPVRVYYNLTVNFRLDKDKKAADL